MLTDVNFIIPPPFSSLISKHCDISQNVHIILINLRNGATRRVTRVSLIFNDCFFKKPLVNITYYFKINVSPTIVVLGGQKKCQN